MYSKKQKSQKTARTTGNKSVDRVVDDIYNEINNLVNSVNTPYYKSEINTRDGKPGDIRIVQDKSYTGDPASEEREFYIEGKTDEGWVRQVMDRTEHSGVSRDGTIPYTSFKINAKTNIKQGALSFWKTDSSPKFSVNKAFSQGIDVYINENVIIGKNATKNLEVTGTLKLATPADGDASAENVLVHDTSDGLIKKRSYAQILSDLGIAADEILDWTADQGDSNIHASNMAGAQTDITSILNSSLKIGRDSGNQISFATDNVIIFKADDDSELRLNATTLRPHVNDGLALGNTSYQFSDLHLASGGVINWDNGNTTLTHAAGKLTLNNILEFGSLSDGTITITDFVDEDNMASNSAVKVPTQQSVKAYVDTEVAGLVDSAPAALDTLNELAAALNDDASFSTTITNSLALKAPLAAPAFTGNATFAGVTDFNSRVDINHTAFPQLTFSDDSGTDILNMGQSGEVFYFKTSDTNNDIRFRRSDNEDLLKLDMSALRVGIGTDSPSEMLHLKGAGDVKIKLEADTDNATETDNPEILFSQDGDIVTGMIGFTADNEFKIANHWSNDSADVLFHASNAQRMVIKGTGKVGIGADAPDELLTIKSSANPKLHIQNGAEDDAGIKLSDADAIASQHFEMLFNSSTEDLRFKSDSVDNILYLDNAGNVGIGTASPDSNLHIKSSSATQPVLQLETALDGGGADTFVRFGDSTEDYSYALGIDDSSNTFRLAYNGSSYNGAVLGTNDLLTVTTAGNVGIGTTSPSVNLHVKDDSGSNTLETIRIENSNGYAELGAQSTYVRLLAGGSLTYAANSSASYFYIGGSGKMGLTSTGLGIGTTAPSTALEIQDGLTTTGAVMTLSTKEPSVVANDVLGRINFQAPLDTGADSDLVGASIVAIAEDTFSDTVNSTSLQFQTGTSETATTRMTIDEAGKVGIGTTSPAQKLDVSGNVNITGTITNAEWNGDVIASAYLDSDTAHLSGTQTFTGAKTFSATTTMTSSAILSGTTTIADARITMKDTRSTYDAPDVFNKEVRFEFKQSSAIGGPSGIATYGGLITIAPWGDSSGDAHHQLFFIGNDSTTTNGGIFWRTGDPSDSATSDWGDFKQIFTTLDTIPVANGGTGATSLDNLITLGNHTTGNYVASLTAGNLIDVGGGAEGGTPTIDVDLSEALEASIADGDYILFLDGGASGDGKKEALHDVATLFAGSGLTATNSVIAVDTLNQDTTGTAANATHVTVTDNESTNEDNLIPFIENASATGNVGLESDGDFHYNPSTGRVTATQFVGTLMTGSQTNITSVGTIGTGTWEGTVIQSPYLDNELTDQSSILNASLVIGRDADNQIKFGTDNQITFEVDGGDNVLFKTGGEIEATSLDISGDVDVDGTLETDALTVGLILNAQEPAYITAGTDTTNILWGLGLKNYGNANNTNEYGVGMKFRGGGNTEHSKWAGIAAVNNGGWFNNCDLVFYVDEAERFRITKNGDSSLSGHFNITTGHEFKINDTSVLSNNTLGSGVTASSLTSVGTITSGTWEGTAIAHAQIGNDAIDGDNIANDSVNSEHYVDGSIDTAHIADNQVTYAKIQNVSATDRILGRDSTGAGVIEEITPGALRTMINVEDNATADQTGVEIIGLLNSDLGGNFTIGNQSDDSATFSGDVIISGDLTVNGGDMLFDNLTTAKALIIKASDDESAAIEFHADNASDNEDKWQIEAHKDDGDLYFYNMTSGSWAQKFKVTDTGNAVVNNALFIGSVPSGDGSSENVLVFDSGTSRVEKRTYAELRSDLGIADNEIIDWTAGSAGTIDASNIPTLNQSTTGTATNATNAANVAVTANSSENVTHYITYVDDTTSNQEINVDTGFTYNPNSGQLTYAIANLSSGIHLGNADTTLTRASAGNVNIEGNIVYRAGGTDVPVADGGTGASNAADARSNLGITYANIGTVDISANTNLSAGTNITLSGDTLNVDDAFLKNDANDTTTGTITAGGFTTTGTWTFDEHTSGTVGITTVQDSGTNMADNDTSLLTAGAIVDYVTSLGYTSNAGDITAVRLNCSLQYDVSTSNILLNSSGSANFNLSSSTGVNVAGDSSTNTAYFSIASAQTGINSILHASLVVGRDGDNQIDFSTDNEIHFKTNAETPVIKMKSSGEIEATKFDGALEGNADTATEATNITVTANNSTDETTYLTFVDGATGTQGAETDTTLTYNPSTNLLGVANISHYLDTKIHQFYSNSSSAFYMPFGASQIESSSTADSLNDDTLFIAPYNGSLMKLVIQCATGASASAAGATRISLQVNGSNHSEGYVQATIANEVTQTFTFGKDYTFDAGDRLRLQMDTAAAPKYVTATTAWKWYPY